MATATASKSAGRAPKNKWIIVRHSKVHGYGCFARCDIKKGTRLIEYVGDRISHKEADKRYEDADPNDNHTFLFIADRKTVIDASFGGNESRFINHSCDGNCTSEIEKGRVFIDATRDIRKGEELGYDYQIPRDRNDPLNVDKIYACRCGSPKCRGTMLWPAKRPKPRKKVKAKSKSKSTSKSKSRSRPAKGDARTRAGGKARKR
jgi:SET domain-containing protein